MSGKLHYPMVWIFEPGHPGLNNMYWHFGCGMYDKGQVDIMSERSYKRALKDKKAWEKKNHVITKI